MLDSMDLICLRMQLSPLPSCCVLVCYNIASLHNPLVNLFLLLLLLAAAAAAFAGAAAFAAAGAAAIPLI